MKKKIKFTRQFDQMDCGPSCIRMVASAYGKDYPLGYLRTLSHLTREGVSIAGMRDAMGHIGINSASFHLTIWQLREKCPLPAILHWEQCHFVVIYGVEKSRFSGKWKYYIANPAFGRQIIGDDELRTKWLNGDTGVVVACEPTDEFYALKPTRQRHSIVAFARRFVMPFKGEMVVTGAAILFGMLLSMAMPFLTQFLVDDGIGMRSRNTIVCIMLAQLCLHLGSLGMNLVSSWVTLHMSTRININVLSSYLEKLMRLPMTFFDTKSVGDYQQRLAENNRLQQFVTFSSLETLFSLLSVPVLLGVIGYYDLWILAAYALFTVASIAWMVHFFGRRKALDYELFALNAANQNKMYELMSGIADIKVNNYEGRKLDEWREMQERIFDMKKRSLYLEQTQNTGYTLLGHLRNITMTFWVAMAVVEGDLTLGMMMSISSIVGQVNGPLSQLIGFMQQYQNARISLERSEEVHLCDNEDTEGLTDIATDHPMNIRISHMSFSYTGFIGKKALDNITLDIPAGKTTAIVGESGSGKTTLLRLLLKFYAPTEGSITYGNTDISQYSASSLRRASGIVMQDSFVFSDTIQNNIVLGEDYDDQRLRDAIHMACLDSYIDSLPLGVHTKIGSEGIGVSGGERQRMMIARAVYKRPQYLMMDEATSSLDAENERSITENISAICHGRTLLVIAHRLSTVKNADNIVVLYHGRVVEQGTHNQLVSQRGYYYELIKNQLELEK